MVDWQPIFAGAVVFAGSFVVLSIIEKIIHRITHNPDVSYKWGVWTFSLLAAAWAVFTSLGRH
jgi:hypothetical protein